jgi:hypothetical protein
MPKRVRDAQRRKLYRFEKQHPLLRPLWSARITNEQAMAMVIKVCQDLGRKVPEVRFSCRTGAAAASTSWIRFTPDKVSPILVLHEVAHVLTWISEDPEGHGPAYVGCYFALLERYLGISSDVLVADAKKGIEVTRWGTERCGSYEVKINTPWAPNGYVTKTVHRTKTVEKKSKVTLRVHIPTLEKYLGR